MNDKLLNALDSVEELLVKEYKNLGLQCSMAIRTRPAAEYDDLEARRQRVGILLHKVRELLRESAPELYPEF